MAMSVLQSTNEKLADANEIPQFRCVVVGEGGTGKTTFIRQHLTGVFKSEYVATLGHIVYPMLFMTTAGPVKFIVIDTEGQSNSSELRDAYYRDANCGIIFYDASSRITAKGVKAYEKDIGRVCGKVPLVICGNKFDLLEKKGRQGQSPMGGPHCQHYFVSGKENYNFDLPFLWLARTLLGIPDLALVKKPVLVKADFDSSLEWLDEAEGGVQALNRTI